ncbi:MAG: DnaJ domain-containing protein [bacterium]|nr:DnaJ domain-containing protein [bacterium]
MVLSSEKNYYEILEVSNDASLSEIKSAYRRLARKYHPDLNDGNADCIKKFKAVSEAYEVLSNSSKRRDYDILRNVRKTSYHSNSFNQARQEYKKEQRNYEKEKNDEPFSNIFNDILSKFKNTTSSTQRSEFRTELKPKIGTNLEAEITISLKEAIEGTVRTVNLVHSHACENCHGRVFLNGAKCPVCGGKGEVTNHKKLTVKIPKNIKSGSKIRIPNEGNAGYNGGRNGDLYLTVKIENNSKFTIDGRNICTEILISPSEAVLGGVVNLKTFNGTLKVRIAPNTHSGQKLRLHGQGFELNGEKGDMIVTVKIEVPKNLSEKELELYKELQRISTSNIREEN